jgi:hypothetical protein
MKSQNWTDIAAFLDAQRKNGRDNRGGKKNRAWNRGKSHALPS